MPKDWFSVSSCFDLTSLPARSQIHVIGVAGVAMAQLALQLIEEGFIVSGSDKQFYEPMGSLLRTSPIKLFEGYRAENVPENVDCVVIGNAVSYGHPEVAVIEERNLNYTMFPRALFDIALKGTHRIACSGTHGKTTVSAMAAYALSQMNADPSFFVGGAIRGLDRSLKKGAGEISVIEADEYDSAFFAKIPKFMFYRPNSLIITSIEFDHADIYTSIDDILERFDELLASMEHGSTVYVCIDDSRIAERLPKWTRMQGLQFVSYGESDNAAVRLQGLWHESGCQRASIMRADAETTLSLRVPGSYNLKNAMAVWACLCDRGLDAQQICSALEQFQGARRRQELRWAGQGCMLIEDFAHHPTAVAETLEGIAQFYPDKKILAVFEPRSATSRTKTFQQAYADSFAAADSVIVADVADADQESFSSKQLALDLAARKIDAANIAEVQQIADVVLDSARSGDCIVVMSNGGFGGLIDLLIDGLKKKFGDDQV